MAGVLTTEASKWAEVVESNGEQALLSPISAKNVEHVLSTATVRGPQSNLWKVTLPFVPRMVEDANGVSILTSLVKYGTPKTVEGVMKELVAADKELWSLAKDPSKELASSLGELLDSLVYREDCRGEFGASVISALSSAKVEKLLSTAFTLPASGRLFSHDTQFAARVVKDEKGKKALHDASLSASEKKSAVAFTEQVLKTKEDNNAASKFLFDVFFVPAPDATKRPREEIIHAIVSQGAAEIVSKVAKVLLKWPNLCELMKRERFASIFADVILHASDAESAKRLTLSLFSTVADIDAMLAGRKKSHLRLLAAIDERPAIVSALEKKLGTPLSGKLRGSKVRYTNATVPRATATQQAIMAKLERLRASGTPAGNPVVPSTQKKAGHKRPRE